MKINDLDFSPWTAVQFIRQICPYCNTPNEVKNNSCVKCGGPLQSVQYGREKEIVLPLDKAIMIKHTWYNDNITYILKMNGKTLTYKYDWETLKHIEYPLRDLAIRFRVPCEFFQPEKWHRFSIFQENIWVRDE